MEKKPDYLGLYCRIVVWGLLVLSLLACAYLFLLRSMNARESEAAQRGFITLLDTQDDLSFTSEKFISKVEEQFQLHSQLMQSVIIRDANSNSLLNSFYRENEDLDREGQLLGGFFNNIQYKKNTDYLDLSKNNRVLSLETVYYVLPMSQLYNIVSLFFYICVTFLIATLALLAVLLKKRATVATATTKPAKTNQSAFSRKNNVQKNEQAGESETFTQFNEDGSLNLQQDSLLFPARAKDEEKGENPFHILKSQEEKESTKEDMESLFDFFDEEKVDEEKSQLEEPSLSKIFDDAEQNASSSSRLPNFPESPIPDLQQQEESETFESLSSEQPDDPLATEELDSFESLGSEQPDDPLATAELDPFESLSSEQPDDPLATAELDPFESLSSEQPDDPLATEELDPFESLGSEQPDDPLATEELDSFESLGSEQPDDPLATEELDPFESLSSEQPDDPLATEELDPFASLSSEQADDPLATEELDSFESLGSEQPDDPLATEELDSFESLSSEQPDEPATEELDSFASLSSEQPDEPLATEEDPYPFLAVDDQEELSQPDAEKSDPVSQNSEQGKEESPNAEDIFDDLENQLDELSAMEELGQPQDQQEDLGTSLSEAELLLGTYPQEDDVTQLPKEGETTEFPEERESAGVTNSETEDLHALPSQNLAENALNHQGDDAEQQESSNFSEESFWQKFLAEQAAPLSSLVDPLLAGGYDFSLSLLSAAQPFRELLLEKFDSEDLLFANDHEAIIVLRNENLANAVQQLQAKLEGLTQPCCGVSAYHSERIDVDKLTLLEEARYAWLNTSAEKSISAYSSP